MAEEPKKISFGFSKITKKAAIAAPKVEKSEIQFIDCLEENSIKLVNAEEIKDNVLIIPLKNGNALKDNMIEALKIRREERKQKKQETKEDSTTTENESEQRPLTLDELAAKEIIEDLKKVKEAENIADTRTILTGTNTISEAKESTLEDYENIPVNEFGKAVLRGMGWTPGKGIGQNAQVVEVLDPHLRPKGMGLGADKVMPKVVTSSNEDLVMKKGASVKIVSGPYKLLYGKVEGFDELPGRLMVKLMLQNVVISISENLVQLVPADEFNKQSKILNLNDFNKFKEKKESNSQLLDKNTNLKNPIQQQIQGKKNLSHNESDKGSKEKKKYKQSSEECSESDDHHDRRKKGHKLKKKKHRSRSREEKDKYKSTSYHGKPKKHYKKERDRSSSSSGNEHKYEKQSRQRRSQSSDSDSDYKKSYNIKKSSSTVRDKSKTSHNSNLNASYKSRSKKAGTSNSSDSEIDKKHYKSSSKKNSHTHKKYSKNRNNSDSDSSSGQESKHRKNKRNHKRYHSRSRSPSKKKHYSSKF